MVMYTACQNARFDTEDVYHHSGFFLHSGFLLGEGLAGKKFGIGFFGRAKLALHVFPSSEPKSQKGLARPRQPSGLG